MRETENSFFSDDMAELVEVFQRETLELTDEYNNALMQIARDGKVTPGAINSIFRAVHTIKSSSAMLGLSSFSRCAHRLEELLILVRDDPTLANGKEEELTELLYAFSDAVSAELDRMNEPDYRPTDMSALHGSVDSVLPHFTGQGGGASAAPSPAPSAPAGQDETTYCIRFKADCSMENVRAFQLVKQLKATCASLSTLPAEFDKQSTSATIRSNGLIVTLLSGSLAQVDKILSASPYVESYEDINRDRGEAQKSDAPEETADKGGDKNAKYGKVAWDKILKMQNLTGELITSHTMIKTAAKETDAYKELEGYLAANHRLLAELESLVGSVSMTPVSTIATRYYRLIHDISKNENKQIEFILTGEEIELDRNLLDRMSNALIHLIRNSVDHGIEPPEVRQKLGKPPLGQVRLTVDSLGSNVRFTISDDGCGIDTEAVLKKAKAKGLLKKPEKEYTKKELINFIFAPGFSTKQTANQYSGRGVGMDVVQDTVDSLGGIIKVETEPGKGSRFIIEMPVTMSSMDCLQFSVGGYNCLVPMRSVEKVYSYRDLESRLKCIDGLLWLEDEEMLPVLDLFALFGADKAAEHDLCLIVLQGIDGTGVILTGGIQDELPVVEKPLPPLIAAHYRNEYGISGCSVIGFGSLSYVLNAELLLKQFSERGDEA